MRIAGQQDLRVAGPSDQGEWAGASRILVEPGGRLVRRVRVGCRGAAVLLDNLAIENTEIRAGQDGQQRLIRVLQDDIDRLRIDDIHGAHVGHVLRRLILEVDHAFQGPFDVIDGNRVAAVELRFGQDEAPALAVRRTGEGLCKCRLHLQVVARRHRYQRFVGGPDRKRRRVLRLACRIEGDGVTDVEAQNQRRLARRGVHPLRQPGGQRRSPHAQQVHHLAPADPADVAHRPLPPFLCRRNHRGNAGRPANSPWREALDTLAASVREQIHALLKPQAVPVKRDLV